MEPKDLQDDRNFVKAPDFAMYTVTRKLAQELETFNQNFSEVDLKQFNSIKGDKGDTPSLQEYFTDERIEEMLGAVTPLYKQDFLTEEEKQEWIQETIAGSRLKQEELAALKVELKGKDGLNGVQMSEVFKFLNSPLGLQSIDASAIKGLPEPFNPEKIVEVMRKMPKEKRLSIRDLEFTQQDLQDLKRGLWKHGGGSAGGGSMAIGGAVAGGTQNRVLLIDAGGNLAQNTEFQYNQTTKRLSVGSITSNALIDVGEATQLVTTPVLLSTNAGGTTGTYQGAINPEGAVSAPIGSIYKNAADGSFWVKATGVGPTGWVLTATTANAWMQLGNAGTNPGTHFIGTTDGVDFVIRTGGVERARFNGLNGKLTLAGDLEVLGTTTTIDSTTLEIEDPNILLGKDNTTDAQANGGGITLKGLTNKTIQWLDVDDSWHFDQTVVAEQNLGVLGNVILGTPVTSRITIPAHFTGATPLTFQGATDNAFTTRFAFTDPTALNIQTFQDKTGFVLLTGVNDILPDNVANAFVLGEGANNYISIDTVDGSENMFFGNATTNPIYKFIGSGLASFQGGLQVDLDAALNGNTTIGDADTDTLTINATIQGAVPFIFEGATANAFELSLAVDEPTADNTLTLPDRTAPISTIFSSLAVTLAAGNTIVTHNGNLAIPKRCVVQVREASTGAITDVTISLFTANTITIVSPVVQVCDVIITM